MCSMLLTDHQRQQQAWAQGEAEVIATMGGINAATAQLCTTIRTLDENGGWHGIGIRSLVHWVTWKADVSEQRAKALVQIARRSHELPACFGMFRDGRLTEDAMKRIAQRVPAERDAEVAGFAAAMTISQLTRVLRTLPPVADPEERHPVDPQRFLRMHERPDGWLRGEFCLPPDESPRLKLGLGTARDAEFRDRKDLGPDDPVDRPVGVDWADALLRMADAATDQLDATLQRTGRVGTRHQIVLHHDLDPEGRLGPGSMHDGVEVSDSVARFLGCDAQVAVNLYLNGRLIGITPRVREPSRALRRALERRDGGCAHPLCSQRRWLHLHHLTYWEDGGETTPSNLLCLCPAHHRGHHAGDFTIDGSPEDRNLTFRDRTGQVIEPPELGPTAPAAPGTATYTPPFGERLAPGSFTWN